MCKCTPHKRTPWCGAPGCEEPPEIQNQIDKLKEELEYCQKERDRLKERVAKLREALGYCAIEPSSLHPANNAQYIRALNALAADYQLEKK